MYNSEHPKLLRNTTPIRDPEVISFIKKTLITKMNDIRPPKNKFNKIFLFTFFVL